MTQKVVLAYSGGLDTSVAIRWLKEKYDMEVIGEIKESLNSFRTKAQRLATEVEFLTTNISDVKVIITGISQGAGYTNEVMKLLRENNQVYAIQAGLPFYYQESTSERVLNLSHNGISPDALSEGNEWGLAKAYLSAPFEWVAYRLQGKQVSFADCARVPGHEYYWNYPQVRDQITIFLENNFN